MRVDVEQIRNNSRVLVRQSRALVKESVSAIERARRLANLSRMLRQEMQPRRTTKRHST
jgi:hypothetical protein